MATDFGSFSWPGNVSSNPSVGSNGTTAPTSSTEIGGVNPEGNLTSVAVADNGSIFTTPDPSGVQHVIVDSSALPTGASTSALQTTGNTSLSSILANQTNNTQTTNVVGTVPLPTGASTSALQTTGNTSLASILANQTNGTQVTTVTGTVPLPTGAATSALQTTGNTSLASIDTKTPALGQAVMASSVPVAIASNQSAIPFSTTDATASGNITTQNLNPNSGAATAGSTVAVTALNGQISWSVQVTGTYTGALTPQVTVDETNWIALSATSITNINTNAQAATITSASVGIFEVSAPPCAQLRITALGAMTGTAVVSIRVSAATGRVGLDSPIPAGTAIIGALSANQSTNVAQINGVAPLMGNGVTGTGSLRVTLASDTRSNTNPLLVSQKGLSSSNAPVQNTYSSTNITTSAYVQLIASTTSAATFIDIFDSSGQAMILATGGSGSEVIQAYVPPGGDSFSFAIPSGTRVAYKALSANATSGYLLMNLRG